MPRLADNLQRVHDRIAGAAQRAGRDASAVTLIAVTKGSGSDAVRQLWEAGQRRFGENRVQEALPKVQAAPSGAEWHLIGHLQENKINKVLPWVHMVQSVDSWQLAAALEQRLAPAGRILPVLLEVKTSPEPGKQGLLPDEVAAVAARFESLPHLRRAGLMTMAPFGAAEPELRRCFGTLRNLAGTLQWPEPPVLSMGMSDDFEVAIEEGSTMVRVGRALMAP
jgi:pyridoxal phosphate enzyme (YggS family)